jgi:hypothetical protein
MASLKDYIKERVLILTNEGKILVGTLQGVGPSFSPVKFNLKDNFGLFLGY